VLEYGEQSRAHDVGVRDAPSALPILYATLQEAAPFAAIPLAKMVLGPAWRALRGTGAVAHDVSAAESALARTETVAADEAGTAAHLEPAALPTPEPPPPAPAPPAGAPSQQMPPRSSYTPATEELAGATRRRVSPLDRGRGARPFYARDPLARPPLPATATWEQMVEAAEQRTPRQATEGFRSEVVRAGNREVVVIEGKVGEQISQTQTLAGYTPTLAGEHATHSVGMQLHENLAEGIVSAPGSALNLSVVKRVENATRTVRDRAVAMGAEVETKTTAMIERRVVNGEEVPVLVGVRREASVRVPGSNRPFQFIDFEARIDPVTRQVTVVRNRIERLEKW
jgi:hypothetical protein